MATLFLSALALMDPLAALRAAAAEEGSVHREDMAHPEMNLRSTIHAPTNKSAQFRGQVPTPGTPGGLETHMQHLGGPRRVHRSIFLQPRVGLRT